MLFCFNNSPLERKVDWIMNALENLSEKMEATLAKLDDLNTSVTNLTTAVGSAVTEIQAEAQKILDGLGSDDTDAVETAAKNIQAQADALNAAVTAAQTPPQGS